MRSVIPLLLALAACGGPAEPPPAESLSWLTGTWTSADKGLHTVEAWRALPDGSLLGSGRAFQPGTPDAPGLERILVFAESMAVIEGEEGPVFVAWPAGAEPVLYTLTEQTPSSVTFANEAHDFPRRLTYARTDALTLEVTASGVGPDGEPRVDAFELTRD